MINVVVKSHRLLLCLLQLQLLLRLVLVTLCRGRESSCLFHGICISTVHNNSLRGLTGLASQQLREPGVVHSSDALTALSEKSLAKNISTVNNGSH